MKSLRIAGVITALALLASCVVSPSLDDENHPILGRSFVNPPATGTPMTCSESNTLHRNDDESSELVNIGFPINYFGTTYDKLYVNNNGNVTFDESLREYVPFDLRDTDRRIIAPYFADVDTRPENSGTVKYGSGTFAGRPAFCVVWNVVGYFFEHVDRLNIFAMWLVDRSDRAPGDFDIAFRYERLQWELGDASAGVPARVGFSAGTGNPAQSLELVGSAVPGAFLDQNPEGLIHRRTNSADRRVWVFPIAGGDLCLTGTGCATDVTVSGIEVTQGLQDMDNDVQLVRGRPTVARAYVSSAATSQVRGLLYAYLPTFEQLPGSPIGTVDAASVQVTPETAGLGRGNLASSMNFVLPDAWTTNPEVRLFLEVPGARLTCNDPDNDCGTVAAFAETVPLKVKTLSVPGVAPVSVSSTIAREQALRIQSIVPGSRLEWSHGTLGAGACGQAGQACDQDAMLRAVADLRARECADPCDTFYLAVIGGPWSVDGTVTESLSGFTYLGDDEAPLSSSVGYAAVRARSLDPAVVESSSSRNVAAHEFGHALGLEHAYKAGQAGVCGESAGSASPPHPYFATIGGQEVATLGPASPETAKVMGLDVRMLLAGRTDFVLASPEDVYALMSYCGSVSGIPHGNQHQWAALNEYQRFLGAFTGAASLLADSSAVLLDGAYLDISIGADTDVVLDATLSSLGADASPAGDWDVELRGAADAVVATYPFAPAAPGEHDGIDLPRTARVALDDLGPDITRIRVLGPLGQELMSSAVSANAPSVDVSAVAAATSAEVTWSATDADGDPMTVDLFYESADGVFVPLGRRLAASGSTTVPFAGLEVDATTRFRAVASDGTHLTTDDTAAVAVPEAPNTVLIDNPIAGAAFSGEMPVILNGVAVGTPGASDEIVWASSLDGVLGTGAQVVSAANRLSSGHHIITATVPAASGGGSSTVEVDVSGGDAPGAPTNLTLTPDAGVLVARWTPPVGPVAPTGYRITVPASGISFDVPRYHAVTRVEPLDVGTHTVSVQALYHGTAGPAATGTGTVTTVYDQASLRAIGAWFAAFTPLRISDVGARRTSRGTMVMVRMMGLGAHDQPLVVDRLARTRVVRNGRRTTVWRWRRVGTMETKWDGFAATHFRTRLKAGVQLRVRSRTFGELERRAEVAPQIRIPTSRRTGGGG